MVPHERLMLASGDQRNLKTNRLQPGVAPEGGGRGGCSPQSGNIDACRGIFDGKLRFYAHKDAL